MGLGIVVENINATVFNPERTRMITVDIDIYH